LQIEKWLDRKQLVEFNGDFWRGQELVEESLMSLYWDQFYSRSSLVIWEREWIVTSPISQMIASYFGKSAMLVVRIIRRTSVS